MDHCPGKTDKFSEAGKLLYTEQSVANTHAKRLAERRNLSPYFAQSLTHT